MESPLKILKRYRIRPVKRLGQSFLVDNNITSRIVDASKIDGGDTVVDIGAGAGHHDLDDRRESKKGTSPLK